MFLSQVATGQNFFGLVPWVIFFPLIGMLTNIIFGGRFSEKVIGTVASVASGLAFVVAVFLMVSLTGHPEGAVVPFLDWISIGPLDLNWSFQVDTLSVTMMLVVTGVGTLIHVYSIGYMHEDVRLNGDPGRFRRFFVFMNFFIIAMMVLVSSDNYLMLFVGWEGVGLASYLLIGFWYDKGENFIGNAIAAKKAFVTNRIGDFGFLIGAFIMFNAFGTFAFRGVFEQVPTVAEVAPGAILAITLFFLLGVTGKSAQLPLFVWLPDAMAGPTPVSALIHAATMVTAGVYLVARSYPLYVEVPQAQNIVALVGGATALFAATIAVAQFDIKKVLAYSTISQLGFMVAAVGMGAFVAGMFHLVTHAFFKALLFLSAGSVIQGVEAGEHHIAHDPRLKKTVKAHGSHHFNAQDMRNMGGLKDRMKITFWVYLIGGLALAGIPPFAGFWSKDEILVEALELQPVVYIMLVIAAFFTAFYVGRQIFMVFFGKPRTEPAAYAQENPPVMTVPLIALALLSVLGGALNLPGFHAFGSWLEHTIQIQHGPAEEAAAEAGHAASASGISAFFGALNWPVIILATGLAVIALGLAWLIYRRRYERMLQLPPAKRPDDPLRPVLGPIFVGMNNKWWVDELYAAVILRPYMALSVVLADIIDWRFWHDWFHDTVIAGGFRLISRLLAVRIDLGVIDATANGLARGVRGIAGELRGIQTGFVRNYALSVFLGVVVVIGILLLW